MALNDEFAEADEQVRQFRDRLAAGGQCELREFGDSTELGRQLNEILASWWEAIRPEPR